MRKSLLISIANNRLISFNFHRRDRRVVLDTRPPRLRHYRVIVQLSEGHEVDDLDDGENGNAQEQAQDAAEVGDEVGVAVKLIPL